MHRCLKPALLLISSRGRLLYLLKQCRKERAAHLLCEPSKHSSDELEFKFQPLLNNILVYGPHGYRKMSISTCSCFISHLSDSDTVPASLQARRSARFGS